MPPTTSDTPTPTTVTEVKAPYSRNTTYLACLVTAVVSGVAGYAACSLLANRKAEHEQAAAHTPTSM